MPLLTFDIIEGRSENEIKTLLDAAHRAVVQAFKVPERDRYQIVHENKAHHMIIEDTGLGLTRSRARGGGEGIYQPAQRRTEAAFLCHPAG